MRYVVVDIDGTISKVGDRLKYISKEPKDWDSFYFNCFEDEPIYEVVDLINFLSHRYGIIFCTGRRIGVIDQTIKWIKKHCHVVAENGFLIAMRHDGDLRHDTEVKPEILEEIKKKNNIKADDIEFILEDRNSMVKKWRELGYKCFQVAEGDF